MQVRLSNKIDHLSRKGFTLSEVLISVALMAFVATAAIGGLVVLSHIRDSIDRQNKAEMVMIATVSYLRNDLNTCTNPHTMYCYCSSSYYPIENTNDDKFASDFFQLATNVGSGDLRYINVIIRDKNFNTVATTTCGAPIVQYWNSTLDPNKDPKNYGICVGLKYPNGVPTPTFVDPTANLKIGDYFNTSFYIHRKYILAQNVMQDTGMYSLIGDGTLNVGDTYVSKTTEAIVWDNTDKLFKFWVYVIDAQTKEIIMTQYVEVCPDTLLPNTNTSNP